MLFLVSFENAIGSVLTDRLTKLENKIIEIETKDKEEDKLFEERFYAMLRSDIWFARYVETLAKNTSVTQEKIIEFCDLHKEDKGIVMYKYNEKLVVAFKSRVSSNLDFLSKKEALKYIKKDS
ncbi:MAG: hypothetical protein QNJ55_19075 [Xenococcus sp. MO_188.B8]|nr:hypothetical protein [Xenococcus sp. MO_188.B8]